MNKIACPECHNLVLERASHCNYCGTQLRLPPTHLNSSSRATHRLIDHEPTRVLAYDRAGQGLPRQEGMGAAGARKRATWQTIVETSSRPVPAHPSHPPRPRRPAQSWPFLRNIPYGSPFRTALFFWVSVIILFVTVSAGVFGIARSFGSGVNPPAFIKGFPELQVTPNIAAIGATVSLHGDGFTAHGQIGLFRDNAIPLSDIHASETLSANAQGVIDDTVRVGTYWGSGEHTILAEDATTHKISTFPLQIIGDTGPLRPAHLHLSTDNLDLGSGDQATNALQMVTLSNSGSGQINWQGSTTQPWLMLSPRSGQLYAEQPANITVAVDRYNLSPGTYSASAYFSSDSGVSVLNVTMKVTPLLTGNDAVLQLTPPVLSLNAVDGTASSDPQAVTVSNPGHAALSWHAASSTKWLRLSQSSGVIAPSHSSSVAINIQTASLLPGTHSARLTFSAEGPALHSPQQVIVSVTILPQCSVQVGPGIINFDGGVQQGPPAPQALAISSSASCTAPIHWTARSNANWIVLSASSGLSSSSPKISVNPAGLAAGSHQGLVVFSTATGLQTIVVNFFLSSAGAPSLDVGASVLNFQGTMGDGNPGVQALTLTNTGQRTLLWGVSASTTDGGHWLSVSTASGALGPRQKTALGVSVSQLASFAPGRYSGMVVISATDSSRHLSSLKKISVPVSFVIGAACSVSVTPDVLTFSVHSGPTSSNALPVSIIASNTCQHALSWQAVAVTNSGGNWLSVLPGNGSLTSAQVAVARVRINSNSLSTQTYQGALKIVVVDTVTHRVVGSIQVVNVTLNVQPPCTLQVPSNANLAFNALPGQNPASQTVSISVVGNCDSGDVTVVPTALLSDGTSWLKVSRATVTLRSGASALLAISADTSHLAANHYAGSISVAALMNGLAIVGSPQTVGVTLDVASAPALSVSPVNGLHFAMTTGDTSSQILSVSNTGGGSMNWSAAIQPGSAPFVSLAQGTGTSLVGGSSASSSVVVDATAAAVGDYSATIVVSGIDASSGQALGTTISIPVTISVTAPVTPVPTPTPTAQPTPTGSPPATATIVPATGSVTATTQVSPSATVATPQSGGASTATRVAAVPSTAPKASIVHH